MAWTSPRTWVTGETVTAALLNTHVRDNLDAIVPDDQVTAASWSPSLEATTTDPSIASTTGRQWRVGPVQHVWVRFVFDSGFNNQGSGTYFVTLPVTASGLTTDSASGQVVGNYFAKDNDTGSNNVSGTVILASTTTVRFEGPRLSDSNPFTFDTDDVISFRASYTVA